MTDRRFSSGSFRRPRVGHIMTLRFHDFLLWWLLACCGCDSSPLLKFSAAPVLTILQRTEHALSSAWSIFRVQRSSDAQERNALARLDLGIPCRYFDFILKTMHHHCQQRHPRQDCHYCRRHRRDFIKTKNFSTIPSLSLLGQNIKSLVLHCHHP